MNPEEELEIIEAAIDRLRWQMKPLLERRRRLEDILAGPRVKPVLVYWENGVRHEEVCEDLEEAFAEARGFLNDGGAWAESVTVGGAEVRHEDWEVPE